MFDETGPPLPPYRPIQGVGRGYGPPPPPAPAPPPPPAPPAISRAWTFRDMLIIGASIAIALFAVYPSVRYLTDLAIDQEQNPTLELAIDMNAAFFTYLTVFVNALILALLMGRTFRDFGFQMPQQPWLWMAFAVGLGVIFIPIRLVLVVMIALIVSPSSLTQGEADTAPLDMNIDGAYAAWLVIAVAQAGVMVVIFAPLVEEFIFRGILQPYTRKRLGIVLSVVISAILFGLAHQEPFLVMSNIVLGFVLALAYEFSKSLWVVILIHFVNNFLVAAFVALLAVLLVLGGGV